MTDIEIIQTENILFRYFRAVKIHKHFLKSGCPVEYIRNYELKDISIILNNMDLAEYEQTVIVFYGNRLHRPPYRGRYRNVWEQTITKIKDEFKSKGII